MATKAKTKAGKRKWSAKVTKESDALSLEKQIFKSKDPDKIAASLKHSAEQSQKRKASPFQSAISMLNFYENRAGENLSRRQRAPLEKAKNKLRKLFGRSEK
ncbi:MAG: hypothetical protein JWP78_1052 [Mucilaginibacter sp.]|nr:hypothetical protein [Mucilaginibacter sp.]